MISQYVLKSEIDGIQQFTENLYDKTINRYNISYNSKKPHLFVNDLTRKIKRSRDSIHHFMHPFMVATYPIKPKNSIITVHDCIVDNFYHEKNSFPIRKHFSDYHVTTVSEFSKNDIAQTYDIDKSNISITPNSVDTNKFFKTKEKDFSEVNMLYVGSLLPHKNFLFLVEVAKELNACLDKKITLTRVGYSNSKQETFQFDGITTIDAGNVNNLNDYYNNANVYVTSSFYEGFNIPIIEAMATGTLVCACKETAHPEIVGDAGIILDFDTDRWVNIIYDLEKLSNKYQEPMKKNVEKYSVENGKRKLFNIYNSMK